MQAKLEVVILGENGSVHVQKWIAALCKYNTLKLHVITFDRGIQFENVNYHFLKKITGTKLDYILNVFLVKKIIKDIKPKLIHAHYATSYGLLGALTRFHPYIITGWGADIFDSPKNFLMRKIVKFSLRKANRITVLSEITKKEILKLTSKEITLIPFGVDINKFSPIEDREQYTQLRIGTIRTLSEKYGVEYLIRSFAIALKKHPNTTLEIVGDGPLKASLENLCIELNIKDKVTFHGYINQNSDFQRYIALLRSFDVFAILSILDSETFGVAAVEASAVSIPVIASNVGGLPEVITHNHTGLIVEPKNVESTFKAIDLLLSDKSLRNQLGKNGREKVELIYNWKNNCDQMVELYFKTANFS